MRNETIRSYSELINISLGERFFTGVASAMRLKISVKYLLIIQALCLFSDSARLVDAGYFRMGMLIDDSGSAFYSKISLPEKVCMAV